MPMSTAIEPSRTLTSAEGASARAAPVKRTSSSNVAPPWLPASSSAALTPSCDSSSVPHSSGAGGSTLSHSPSAKSGLRTPRRKLTSSGSSVFTPCDGEKASSLPRVPTREISSWWRDASANMQSSRQARAPEANSTSTYALSSTSAGAPSYVSRRKLASCPPVAMTRVGSLCKMRRIKSKKWQHFSTSVPPVRALKRFQLPTLRRKGKRCSRIESMRRSPTTPPDASLTRRAIDGM
mmetsp:Transcript_4925/g.12983  ORF Transcript_4925/g.12983 Transcript_4925/m.12983 type:complete len:237 (-) Transcript_4925:528-1238(-)